MMFRFEVLVVILSSFSRSSFLTWNVNTLLPAPFAERLLWRGFSLFLFLYTSFPFKKFRTIMRQNWWTENTPGIFCCLKAFSYKRPPLIDVQTEIAAFGSFA